MSTVEAVVDWENTGEVWWGAFRKAFPHLADKDHFEFTPEEWEVVTSLPGWSDPDAPEYAPHPLIVLD